VHFLDKASRDLFICAKYLFVGATAGPQTLGPIAANRRGHVMKRIGVVIGLVGVLTVQALAQQRPEEKRTDENVQVMIQAARSLKFPDGNMAFILEKQEVAIAEVAVIFGYADNRSACQQIADILIASRRAGTFKCHPVY
jgi:hypothetical protein